MKMIVAGPVLAALMVATGPSQAAVLQLNAGTGTGSTIPDNFDPVGLPGGLISTGDPITVYESGDSGGLALSGGPAILEVEYLGSEADFANSFSFSGASFTNTASSVGETAPVFAGVGSLPLSFTTEGPSTANNDGLIDLGLSIAFANLGDGTFLALFNDGGGSDTDLDDLVVRVSVSQVPLPPAVWLLISAIVGLVSFARIRRTEPRAP
jgi:hypothetical protein